MHGHVKFTKHPAKWLKITAHYISPRRGQSANLMSKKNFMMIAVSCAALLALPTHAAPPEVPAAPVEQTAPVAAPSPAPALTTNPVESLLASAKELIGTPYRYGSIDPAAGLDCSGLVGYLFQSNFGLTLPRRSVDMSKIGEKISKADLQPGDLLFFKTVKKTISHVGVYIGNGEFIHAPWHGRNVEIANMELKYWQKRFAVAKRLDLENAPPVAPQPVAMHE